MTTQTLKPHAGSLWVIFLLMVLGIGWGLHFSLIKIAAESGLPFTGITALTTMGILIFMLSVCAFRRRWPALRPGALRFYLICAVLGYIVAFFVELEVSQHIAAGELTLIVATTPVWTFLITRLMRRKPVALRQIAGLSLGLGAVSVLIFPQLTLESGSTTFWLALAFLVPLTYASYHNVVEAAWPEGMDSWQVACGETIAATLLLTPLFLTFGDGVGAYLDWTSGSWTIPVMAFMALWEIYLYFEVVRLSSAIVVSQANYVTIISGLIWGALIFGEVISGLVVACAVLTIAALFLTTERR
ncbi:MAG: DMT family transporter [Pseudomonadota bacterium]